MASLSTIITNRNPTYEAEEKNLEKGNLFYFTPASEHSQCTKVTWQSPGAGCARVEIWGAGGSGGKMCCCGQGVPGNPGAYVVKCFLVDAASKVCGCVGVSCGNADAMCYRGRSTGTCICYFGAASDNTICGCLCAQGGEGGTSYCSPSAGSFCCFVADSAFCTTAMTNPAGSAWGTGCGLVCNTRGGTQAAVIANAYGGDINCPGGISCTSFYNCDSANHCYVHYHIRTPAGVHSNQGGMVTFSGDNDSAIAVGGGAQYHQSHYYALQGMKRDPSQGFHIMLCYFGRMCGCYENNGCQYTAPHGHGGAPTMTCNSVRDNAQRGGFGGVRILWQAAE